MQSAVLEDLNAKLTETSNILQYTPVEKPTELLSVLEQESVEKLNKTEFHNPQQEANVPTQPVPQQKSPAFSVEEKDKENDEEEQIVERQEPAEQDNEAENEVEPEEDAEVEEEDVVEEIEEDDEAEDEEEEEEEEEIIPDEVIVPEDTIPKEKLAEAEKHSEDKDEINNENVDAENDEENDIQEIGSESEEPISSGRAKQRKEEDVDENQCRVCCTKENLVSIFKKIDNQTVADMLMSICPTVSIVIKDFLPQYICNACYDNVVIAVQLKNQCETTEKELRKKLSRHKNKIRRPAGYVVIDAPLDSDPPTDEEPANDEEFKVSDIASATPTEDSESSDSDSKKKKPRGRKRRRSAVVTPTDGKRFKNKSRSDNQSSDEDDDDGDPIKHKRKRSDNSSPENFACDDCSQTFSRKQSLVMHRRQHIYEKGEPITCEVCGKKFKIKGAYRTHLEKHKEERKSVKKCAQCSKRFSSSSDLKRHIVEMHKEKEVWLACKKCGRSFASAGRLERHKQAGCPAIETSKSRKSETNSFTVGTDLFKAVAPLQTTYWSDSFSD